MTVAQRTDDFEFIRNQVRMCLRASRRPSRSALADMQTTRAKGEQKLKRPSGTYTIIVDGEPVQKKKPEWGQWSTLTHATPTRAAARPHENITELDYADSRYVKLIWRMQYEYNRSLLARYSPSKMVRREAAGDLAVFIAQGFTGKVSQSRAAIMAHSLLLNPFAQNGLHIIFGLSWEEWKAGRHRRLAPDVKAELSRLDRESLIVWDVEAQQLGEKNY